MTRLDPRRDGAVLALFVGLLVILVAGLAGSPRAFAYGLVAVLGLFMALGFVRRGDPITWLPPAVATAVLLVAITGMFAGADAVVTSPEETVAGFQTGTAFLVYVLWIPAFFTLAVGFALVFDRLAPEDSADGGSEP